jgi:cobalt-zinc-cadmium efflux system outer membrane protein
MKLIQKDSASGQFIQRTFVTTDIISAFLRAGAPCRGRWRTWAEESKRGQSETSRKEARRMMAMRCWLWPLGLCALCGCGFALRHQLDKEIQDLSAKNGDGAALCGLVNSLPPPPPSVASVEAATVSGSQSERGASTLRGPLEGGTSPTPGNWETTPSELQQVACQQREKLPPIQQRLPIPKELPGADAPDIKIPDDPKERAEYFRKLYPPIPELPPMTPPAPGPEGRPLTLADLQRLGETYNPAIKSAYAAVEAAKAAAYQAGMYPNPTVAWEHDTVETGPAGYPGGYFDQLIITGGKLTVQQAMATMDVLAAKLALRKAKSDMWTQIRSNYFAVLVAYQGIRYSEALFTFANYLYNYQIVQLSVAKKASGYEPMQLRPLVLQARYDIIQARNKYTAAWRQLAASLGLPDMPPSELAGSVHMPMPEFDYNAVLARLEYHTDVRSALVSVQKAKYNVRYQKLVPLPDVGARILTQKDYTTPPNQVVHSAVMYMTLPIWNQNRGGIRQAEWQLAQAAADPVRARNDLVAILADAYNRYITSRQQVDIVQEQIRDLLRSYKNAWARNQVEPLVVSFSDLWPVQITLESYVLMYIGALGAMWQAAVDVANLLQTEDFFQAGQRQVVPAYPVLEDLLMPLRNYPRAPIVPNAAVTAASPLATVVGGATAKQPALAPPSQPAPTPSAPTQSPALMPQSPAIPRRTENGKSPSLEGGPS